MAGRVGVGAVLWQERAGGAIYVHSLLKGSVAEMSGIMPGDQLMSVNGAPVDKGWDVVAVTHTLDGEWGTKLELVLIGGAQGNRQDKVYSVELVRT
jgi:C-terminal processing protease CtpA/Prc